VSGVADNERTNTEKEIEQGEEEDNGRLFLLFSYLWSPPVF